MKGKQFATPVQGSGSYSAFWPMMEHYGIRPNDMQITELTTAQAKTAFEKKRSREL